MKDHAMDAPKICIIGAGPCGLTAAKNMLQQGLTRITVFEKNNQPGGNWIYDEANSHAGIYETTHTISSKYLSEFEDFIMPPGYPEYPSHSRILRYFKLYAEHFGITPYIRFNTCVQQVTRTASGQWQVDYQDESGEQQAVFDYLLVANGHHWDPVMPEYPGEFHGEVLHSHLYKKANPFKNKRVLVVGGGNSACDVAVEVARVSEKSCISMRRGQHIIPKFIFGKPSDIALATLRWMPFACKQLIAGTVIRFLQGKYSKYHLKKPQCKLLEAHPTINSELLYFIRHGKIFPRPGIERMEGDTVQFTDGRREEFDVIIFATGYKTSLPFFSKDFIDYSNLTSIPLYRKMMHPEYDNLYFIGLFQPQGCIWPLADLQARIAARMIAGTLKRPDNLTQKIERELSQSRKRFHNNTRALEVDYAQFRRQLRRELRRKSRPEKVF